MESAADKMSHAADRMEHVMQQLTFLLADGYGNNACRLIELLEKQEAAQSAGKGVE
jgi:hypothetical protein